MLNALSVFDIKLFPKAEAKFYLESYSERDYNFVEIWKHIFDVDNNFISNYPNISLLVEIALIIPLSNATVERIFFKPEFN